MNIHTDQPIALSPLDDGAPHADGRLLRFEITGTGFLRHMVRIIVGTLVDIGRGQHAGRRPRGDHRLARSRTRRSDRASTRPDAVESDVLTEGASRRVLQCMPGDGAEPSCGSLVQPVGLPIHSDSSHITPAARDDHHQQAQERRRHRQREFGPAVTHQHACRARWPSATPCARRAPRAGSFPSAPRPRNETAAQRGNHQHQHQQLADLHADVERQQRRHQVIAGELQALAQQERKAEPVDQPEAERHHPSPLRGSRRRCSRRPCRGSRSRSASRSAAGTTSCRAPCRTPTRSASPNAPR